MERLINYFTTILRFQRYLFPIVTFSLVNLVGIDAFQLLSHSWIGSNVADRAKTYSYGFEQDFRVKYFGINELQHLSAKDSVESYNGDSILPAQLKDLSVDEHSPNCFALSSYLQCYAPLFQSPSLPNGSLDMLFRGCNAHKRLISPLELETNKSSLPGVDAAMFIAKIGIYSVKELLDKFVPLSERSTSTTEDSEMCVSSLLRAEVTKIHRALQYACAAALDENFVSEKSLQVMLELYQDVGLDVTKMKEILEEINSLYQREMPASQYKNYFQPSYNRFMADFKLAEKALKPAKQVALSELSFEPEPDPRTLQPLSLDIMSMDDKLPGVAAWKKRL